MYCRKCGNKISDTAKFCPKCGNKVKENVPVKNKEEKKEKLLLSIGTLLIIVASVVFAFANWNEMTSIFKLLFLIIESLLFLSLAIFSKKVEYKMPYKFLWFIGISFIPIIFNLIATDKLLGDYLSYDGNGIYVYLAISSFICGLLYFISHKFLKSNLFLYISYIFIYLMIIFTTCIFIDKGEYVLAIVNVFNLLVCTFYSFIKNENYNRSINIFMSIVVFILSIITCTYTENNYIIQVIVNTSVIASLILLIFKSKRNIMIYIYPFIINLVFVLFCNNILNGYTNVILFISLLGIILINFAINIKNDSALKNISFIVMLLFIFVTLLNFNVSYLTLAISNLIILLAFVFIIKLNDEKVQVSISKVLLPFSLFLIIYSLLVKFTKIDLSIIYIIVSIICFTIYVIFSQSKKDNFLKTSFQVYAYALLIIAGIIILYTKPLILAFILDEILWLYYFIYSKITKKNKVLNIWLLIMILISFMILSIRYSLSIYYSLLFIAIICAILDFIEIKLNNKSIYIYFSLVFTSFAVLSNLFNNILGIGLLVLVYAFTYYLYNKKHNTQFVIKFLYTLVGFILINSLFRYFIDKEILVNILILASYLIILISMFLLQVDTDRKVLSYSFVILFPYVSLIQSIPALEKYSTSLVSILFIALILIYFEKVFKLKETDKIIFELVLIGLIHLFTINEMLIVNFILSAFYIFYGFYKKRDSFTLFGTILLIVNLIFNIAKIFDNITVTYVILLIGFIMLAYVFYMEAKKKNNKK